MPTAKGSDPDYVPESGVECNWSWMYVECPTKMFGGTVHLFTGQSWILVVLVYSCIPFCWILWYQISLRLLSCTGRVICPGDNFLCTSSSLQFSDRSWERWGFASSVKITATTIPDRAVCIHRRFWKNYSTHYSMTGLVKDYRPFSSQLSSIHSSLETHLHFYTFSHWVPHLLWY